MDVLFVMNAQNSFLSERGSVYMGERAEILKVRLKDYLSGFPGSKIFFRESHAPGDTFFSADKTHSVATSEDFSVHESLMKFANFFIDKTRYSAFFDTPLETNLKHNKVKSVGLVGLETHTSILFTAEELRNKGYEVTAIEPCIMARDESLHSFAITLMRHYLGVKISNG
jgi:nicotinamidase/pyrazinamidase